MCGIAGFTTFKNDVRDRDAVIQEMIDRLAPRGPDGSGTYADSSVTLGHRRLSIIDIDGGRQPMTAADGRFVVTYNGELYNYVELKDQMTAKGKGFATASDTEVLLETLAESGIEALGRFNGMFAFALWDKREEALYLVRDRIGIKPLYYTVQDGELIFASELKSLVAHPATTRELDPLSVSKFLSFTYIPAPHTIYKDVHKLEPGTVLRFDRSGLEKKLYWDIPFEDNPVMGQDLDESAERLRKLLGDSVAKRLRSDVPVGVFLSGGIDSSAIVAFAAQHMSTPLHTFSVGFEESSYDESPYAREVAQLYGTEHHEETLSSERAIKLLPEVMALLDEPFGDASILPTYLLSQFTSRHVKVCLGGDGGDELFAGYPAFQAHKLMERLSFLPTTWRHALNRAARRIPVSHSYASVDYLLQQFFKGTGISPEIRFFMWMGGYSNEQKNQLLTADVQQALLRENPFEDIINYVRQSRLISDFERILYLSMKMYLQDGVLFKVDRASMANGLEVRVPFLDHTIVEFAAGMNAEFKLNGFSSKYILKYAVKGLLPKRIIKRRKAGFMVPLASWLKHDLRGMVEEYCSESVVREDGLFDPAYVRRLLDEHFDNVRDNRKLIWQLLCFQFWKHRS